MGAAAAMDIRTGSELSLTSEFHNKHDWQGIGVKAPHPLHDIGRSVCIVRLRLHEPHFRELYDDTLAALKRFNILRNKAMQ